MDNLKTPAIKFYNGMKLFANHDTPMDIGGRAIIPKACERKHIREAKQYSYMRRVYSDAYLKRDMDKRQMYLSDFDQLGARWVRDADEVSSHIDHKGRYTDDFQDATLIGVLLYFTRHGTGENEEYFGEGRGKSKDIYMAGTRHSDWDGVTLDLDTTDDPITAARWADSMAEREAESCREEDEKYQTEQKAAECRDEIKAARVACLKLLRDMRPIRKGLIGVPESICDALRQQVQSYLEDIANWRKTLGELT
jgi:hypothetical protein